MMRKFSIHAALAIFGLLLAANGAQAGDTTTLRIVVTNQNGRPVDRAGVKVKFEGRSIKKLGFKSGTTYELATNQEGIAKLPPIPQGKIRIQVIAKGYQTFGDVYDIKEDEKTVDIKLNPPQQQYTSHK